MYCPCEPLRFSQPAARACLDAGARPAAPDGLAKAAWRIGEALAQGILLEVGTASKPGLVCPGTSGAHADMSLLTFMVGSAAIIPAFFLCAEAGFAHAGAPEELLGRLRAIGRPYEARLLAATGGVNTQRGALFAGGLVAGAAGALAAEKGWDEEDWLPLPACEVCAQLACMARGLVARELTGAEGGKAARTAGEILFARHGLTGIRGEVEAGLPAVRKAGLPALADAFARAADLDSALLHTLFALMACVDDTTVVWRAGLEGLALVHDGAGAALAAGSVFTQAGRQEMAALERACLARRISPGGCADLLAMTVALWLFENGHFPVPIK